MPHGVRKNPSGGYDIVRKDTGKKVGHSSSKRDAAISASIRDRESGHTSSSSQQKKSGGRKR